MSDSLTVRCAIHVAKAARGRKTVEQGSASVVAAERGRVPRVARLLALALKLDAQLLQGVFAGRGELAALGRVTRARISQILSLAYLAPDIQEAILFLPRTERGRDPVILHDLLPIAAEPDWTKQRRLWQQVF
jgi:hypothetical protein